jgi:glycosyltransferase involved in cell wall biosynthesis
MCETPASFQQQPRQHGITRGGSLLVYVPTYNRYEWALRQLRTLQPQMDPGRIELVVRDNASPDERYLGLGETADSGVSTVYRNVVNTGIIDNLMRSFVDAAGHDYMWMLSDDDPVRPDAVATLEEAGAFDGSVDLTVLLFHDHKDRVEIRDMTIDDIANMLGRAHSINKISNLIWRTEYFLPYVQYGYWYGTFSYCFDATLVAAVQQRGQVRCCLLPAEAVFGPEEHSEDHHPMQYVDSLYGYIWLADLMSEKALRLEFLRTWAHSDLAELAAERAFSHPHRFWWAAGFLMGESPRLAAHLIWRSVAYHYVLDRELNWGLRRSVRRLRRR